MHKGGFTMSDLSKIYSEENLGMPIKVKMGKDEHNNNVYIYGRYYGRGYDGESTIQNDDYYLIALVTAGGSLIRGGVCHYEVIKDNKEDLEKLNYFEELENEPYSPFLKIINDKFYKSYEYKKLPLTYKHYPIKWFEENGYFEIDADLFGNALSALFTAYFGERYFYNKVNIRYEGKSRYGLNYNDIIQSRNMFLLSTKEYQKNSKIFFSEYPYRNRHYFDSMFKQKPISIKEEDYLINFGHPSNSKIRLGKVEDEKFVPNTIPFNDYEHKEEVNYNNQNIDLVEDFIYEIIDYKLSNRKATLDQEDMNKILEKYGISYTDEMCKFINVLKNVNEKAIDTMTRTNQIGKVLCLHK